MNWKTNEQQVQGFGVAAKYYGYKNVVIGGKINNAFELGLGLTYTVTRGTKKNLCFFLLSCPLYAYFL